jgi:hypothetical protein
VRPGVQSLIARHPDDHPRCYPSLFPRHCLHDDGRTDRACAELSQHTEVSIIGLPGQNPRNRKINFHLSRTRCGTNERRGGVWSSVFEWCGDRKCEDVALDNPYTVERKYETTLEYRLSGRELAAGQTKKLTVSLESFHKVEIVTDVYQPTVNY